MPMQTPSQASPPAGPAAPSATPSENAESRLKPRELGGPSGPEPTRYGDWERKGRCIDF